ncbi:hypothetical protein [Sphingopyxis sp. USTB-05]|uniref:hypothetical protein n=1 Tax=Sphingopyxis sp. USTB-05 TaxID=2830667 RepID=UPI002078CE40|nr:hypothetical protein [Sphingopyxis sp. USTB-05]USI76522.1 hypothetical protein KEC45_17460 [Sphingopyxis sp. USTB-05]
MTLHKDKALDRLAGIGNVAQFIAWRPEEGELRQSYSRLIGRDANAEFVSIAEAAGALLLASQDGRVNIRSYLPDDPRSREFVYGLTRVEDVLLHMERLAAEGLHLILNETIDVGDGGVSGVAHDAIIEFAPDDTPRAVEKPDIASLPRDMGLAILEQVYGFAPDIPGDARDRVEFSIHPGPRGWRQTNVLLWEIEADAGARTAPVPRWPNRFSRHIGDKAFGLLAANWFDAPVPSTSVVARRVAPFTFGRPTGSGERWIRTCPREPQPGLFTTARGWRDPFALLAEEDPDASQIASVLAQEGVPPLWSGAALVGADDMVFIEGKAGAGDSLMLGESLPEELPEAIVEDVVRLHARLSAALGPVRIEWVHDGNQPWVVQLHVGATQTSLHALVEGDAEEWIDFEVAAGLPALRLLLEQVPDNAGVNVIGDVGLTSHIADVLRKWGRPARLNRD